MKKLLRGLAFTSLLTVTSVGLAQAPNANGGNSHAEGSGGEQKNHEAHARHTGHAYLGIQVSPVHPAMSANLSEHLSNEQGLIVEDVAEDSAASKAGLRVNDVLINYEDQKLFSVEQLSKLVQADKPGRKVTLEVLRNGKRQKIEATLGERENTEAEWARAQRSPGAMAHRPGAGMQGGPRRYSGEPSQDGAESENFDSLSLRKMGKDKFHVEISYLDKDNKVRKHTFEGSRDEIRRDIDGDKDIKPAERSQLLRSLDLTNGDRMQNPFGGFFGPHGFFDQSGDWYD